MNPRILPLALALLAPSAVPAQDEFASQLRFARNNQLTGELLSLDADRLVWKSPVLKEPTAFWLNKVLDVTLPAATPEFDADHEATLTLTNGDVVRGQLASVTEEEVKLTTWYAGPLSFGRGMVKSLSIDDRPTLVYRGPSGMDGWRQTGDADSWGYQANALRSTSPGGIGREVETPDECRFAFTAEWRGEFRLALNLFSPDLATTSPKSGYRINFDRRMVNLQKIGADLPLGHVATAQELQVNERARIEVRVSHKTGDICLLLDDRLLAVWTDPEPKETIAGKGMQFVSQEAAAVKLSNIEVSAWDGHVERTPEMQFGGGFGGGIRMGFNRFPNEVIEPEPEPELKEGEQGRMALRNGDHIIGEVLSIENGIITIKTAYSEVSLPVARLRDIALKPVAKNVAKLNNGDVRVWFPDGSSMVFRLESMTPDLITGFSQNFGTAEFKRSAFNRIEFNIHDLPLKELRLEETW
jgi:hypothetical protein